MTNLKTEFTKLVRYYASDPTNQQAIIAIRSWFKYWDTEDELAEKVMIWGRFFFPDYMRDPSPSFHLELLKANFSKKNEYNAAPRGFSKTTLVQISIMFEVVNSMQKYIVVIEKAYDEAAEVLAGVRDGLLNRADIDIDDDKRRDFIVGLFNRCYEGLTVYQEKSKKDKDAYGDLVINNVRLRGKGFDGPIRGLKYKAWRPTKIYIDDVEKDEHIESIDQRNKYKKRFKSAVIPAIDPEVGTIKMSGTLLHNDSLLNTMIKQHNGKIYSAYDIKDKENTLLWPERWSLAKLEAKRKEMSEKGRNDADFYREYLNLLFDDDKRPFKWEHLQKTYKSIPDGFNTFIAIDVADATGDKNDYTGVVVVCIDASYNWYIKLAKRYRVSIEGLVDLVFQLWDDYDPIQIGVEKRAFDDQIKPLLDQKSDITGIYPIVEELKHRGESKESRIIGALSGRFEGGKILFADGFPDDQKILQGELYDYPRSKHDDLADGLAYISNMAFNGVIPEEGLPEMETYQYDSSLYNNDDVGKNWTDY